jgi:methylmalonyl-CoA mutase N-terminal domain/subunit
MRLVTDLFAYCREHVPKWNTVSISGYHFREKGCSAVQEVAFTLANGMAYVQAALDAGLAVDDFAPAPGRSSSTATTTSSRRSRSSAPPGTCGRTRMRDRFGAQDRSARRRSASTRRPAA